MPRGAADSFANQFYSAGRWRDEADKWERLADLAETDGDASHVEHARQQASACRQNARLKEVEDAYPEGGNALK